VSASTLRERKFGRLYFGDEQREQWSIADPEAKELNESLHRMRYTPDALTGADLHYVMAAAEAYQHLITYPLRGVAARQFADIRRVCK
jgi:hypothetical protein